MTYGTGVQGSSIVRAAWIGVALFAASALPVAAGVDALGPAAIVVALALFVVALVVWAWAFAVSVARSARGDDIVVASLFLLQGPAPSSVRRSLYLALGAAVVVAASSASREPFGVLAPMLPLGLAGLWGARHGTFPPRAASRAGSRGGEPGRGGAGRASAEPSRRVRPDRAGRRSPRGEPARRASPGAHERSSRGRAGE